MSEQQTTDRGLHLGLRLQKVRMSRGSSIIGINELVALAGTALVVVLVVISYLYFLVPARAQLQTAQNEKARLDGLLSNYRTEVQQEQTTETTIQRITESLDTFETAQLFNRTQGRMDLYGELNELIKKNVLRNTAGPTYIALDPIGDKNSAPSSRSTNNKWQSIYPGIAISVTVEGQYSNLREFIHDIEASKLFVIINAIELERATQSQFSSASGPEGTPRNALVSLRLDMATYFQRYSASAGDSGQVSTN